MNSLQLAWLDLKRLTRSRFVSIALMAVCLMPLLYSFLYLYAFWDPYGKLNQLPVAIVNEDLGGTMAGHDENFGRQLADKLAHNHDVKWALVPRTEAEDGLEHGRYYLALFVPADLTKKVLTATDEQPQKAELIYVANQGSSYLASSIGKKLMGEVKSQVSNEISGKFFENILVGLRDGSTNLKTAADGARKLADGDTAAMQGTKDLQTGVGSLQDGAGQLADGLGATQDGAKRLADGLDQAGTKVAAAGQGAHQLYVGLSSATRGGKQLADGLNQLHGGTTQFAAGIGQLAGGLDAFKASLTDQQKGIPALALGAAQVGTGIDGLNTGVSQGLTELQTGVGNAANGLTSAQALLQRYAAANPAAMADPSFQQALGAVGAVQAGLSNQVAPGTAKLSTQAAAGFKLLADGQTQVVGGLTQLQTATGTALTQLSSGAGALKTNVTALQSGVDQARTGVLQLSGGLTQLSAGANQLQQGLNDPSGMNQLKAGSQALSGALTQLQAGSVRLNDGLGDLHQGVAKLGDGLTQVRDGNDTLATKLTDAASHMADQAKGDPAERGKALATPVLLSEQPIHEVKEYGTGFAPYFIPLSLWVGAMFLFFVVGVKENRVKTSLTSASTMVLSKFFTLATFGTAQAVLSSWILLTFLGLHPQSMWQFYAFNILLSWTFIAIMQTLVSLAGMIGRFGAIVLLMFQLTSCAGTFPLEMLPRFMQSVNPFMPMTYAVAGLRQIIAGSATVSLSTCLVVLIAFLAGGLVVNMLTTSRFVTLKDLHPSHAS